MKSSLMIGWVSTVLLMFVCVTALADDPRLKVKVDVGDKVKVDIGDDAGKAKVDMTYRSSTIIGMPIKNREGENLGHIEDMVIGLRSGEVRYAALSFGGFAGFQDKLFAVPWNELALHVGERDKYFAIDMTKEKLAKAPGFDQSAWPNTAAPNWAEKIDEFYAQSGKDREKDVTDREQRAFRGEGSTRDTGHRVSQITGLSVKNMEDEQLGHIKELVIDLNNGEVRYAALSFGATFGFGGKLFAMPWDILTLNEQEDEKYLVLNLSPERLKVAPGFDSDNWPDTADVKWRDEIDEFYAPETKELQKDSERPADVKEGKEGVNEGKDSAN